VGEFKSNLAASIIEEWRFRFVLNKGVYLLGVSLGAKMGPF